MIQNLFSWQNYFNAYIERMVNDEWWITYTYICFHCHNSTICHSSVQCAVIPLLVEKDTQQCDNIHQAEQSIKMFKEQKYRPNHSIGVSQRSSSTMLNLYKACLLYKIAYCTWTALGNWGGIRFFLLSLTFCFLKIHSNIRRVTLTSVEHTLWIF